MSENAETNNIQQYKYDEMSNKVLRADRRLLDEGIDRNVSTNPQSVQGKISVKDLGSRVAPGKSVDEDEADQIKRQLAASNVKKSKKAKKVNRSGRTLLDTANIEGINYTPTTPENEHVFESVLLWCSRQLDNDVPEDIVRSLADIVLEITKNDTLADYAKKTKLEETLNSKLSDEDFQDVLDLSKKVTDFNIHQQDDSDEDAMGIVIDSADEESDEEAEESDEEEESENEGQQEPNDAAVDDGSDVLQLSKLEEHSTNSQLDIKSIDKYWLTRQLSLELPESDSYKHSETSSKIVALLQELATGSTDIRKFENRLLELFDFESNKLVFTITKSPKLIYYGLKLSGATTDTEKQQILDEMIANNEQSLVDQFKGIRKREEEQENEKATIATKKQRLTESESKIIHQKEAQKPNYVDIDSLVFDQGSHLITTSKFQLPKGSFKRARKGWEEVHIPPPKQPELGEDERLVEISELPEWAQTVFPSTETKTLNRIQSKVYPTAFLDDSNILMCAPTGAGKTNVAMLATLRAISKYMNEDGHINLDDFKIVYIAPLKALVQEQVREFRRRLSHFNITVNELTGDSNLTKHQIASTQILVTTPEKWDVITRKMNDASYVKLVRLIIIDEIHLLHDERGPVIESIVARTLKNSDDNNEEPVRLIGLSATLPNYQDVAKFLRVDENKGLFYFDSSYRPCPLAQQFVGITEKKSLKRFQAMYEVCYEKVIENVINGHQVIIFVHSRKETEKTAKWIVDKLIESEKLGDLMKFSSGVEEILKTEANDAKNKGLKSVVPFGFGVHHAGMNKRDRSTAEDLFAQGYLKVLVSTATLAWGVNLPAHTVIIKGTNVYSPEKGTWVELSPQDILQMLGRAGRPRYDTHGEGIIITAQEELKYYLAILNQQLPIESQLFSRLVDNINAEIVLGSIRTLEDCVSWIGYTYLYVRMLGSRGLYHVGPEYDQDLDLYQRRKDLAHSALLSLAKDGLVKYNFEANFVSATDLGKIASHYYISHRSMKSYDKQLKPWMSEIDLFRIFATSEEFKYVPVRQEEKSELKKLMEKAPIPINESSDDPLAKINMLLQAYISKLKLDGFALMSDMSYVVQSSGRLFRAMLEIAMRKSWAKLFRVLLDLCKMIEQRSWLTNSPFKQFPNVPVEIVHTTERSMIPWKQYLALADEFEVAQALKSERYGKLAYEMLRKFPQLSVTYELQPITPSLLRIEVEVLPQWQWDVSVHGYGESFTLLVEDCDSERILHTSCFVVKEKYKNQPHLLELTVPILDSTQPNYFLSLISDKWLHSETRIPIMLTNLILPKTFPAPTPLSSSELTPVSELEVEEFAKLFDFDSFNRFQSQVFESVYNGEANVLCCCSKGNGKTVIAELALLNHWRNSRGRAIYLLPHQEQIDVLHKVWKKKFAKIAGGKTVEKLTGSLTADLSILAKAHLVLSTPEKFDLVSRRWQQRKNVQAIELIIADDCHTVGNDADGAYEIVLSRMRFIAMNLEKQMRVIALGSSLASGRDFAQWLGVTKQNIYNFDSRERSFPLEVRFRHFEINHNPSLILNMLRPSCTAINDFTAQDGEVKGIVFVPTRRHCVDIAKEYINLMKKDQISWLRTEVESLEPYLKKISDLSLRESLKFGIGYYYKNMSSTDRSMVERLFDAGVLTCLLATKDTCFWCPAANFVIVLSTQVYEGKEHRYVDYTINELLEMVGLARTENNRVAHSLILTNTARLAYYKKFLGESLPIESNLSFFIHEAFVNEISTRLIRNRQDCVDWITYTFFYRRLLQNPSFYNLKDTSELGLSEYLSELVESTLNDLSEAKIIELDIEEEEEEDEEQEEPEEIKPLNDCMIAAYYNVSFVTMRTFSLSLNSKSKLRSLLEVITSANEFESIPIRNHEDETLRKIYNRLPLRISSEPNFESPSLKSFILLQAHISRVSLPPDLTNDLNLILSKIVNLLYAAVDVLSSEGHLNALTAMDLCQMVVQSVWDTDNALKQVPFFDTEILEKCKDRKVETVYDIMALEDDERDSLLETLSEKQLTKVADFVNKYPNLELSYELDLSEPVVANEPKEIIINIERDEEVEDLDVVCPRFPYTKTENWWIVVGEQKKRELYGIKRLTISKEHQQVKINFTIPDAGTHKLSVWCVCDSYIDTDKQIEISDLVVEGA